MSGMDQFVGLTGKSPDPRKGETQTFDKTAVVTDAEKADNQLKEHTVEATDSNNLGAKNKLNK